MRPNSTDSAPHIPAQISVARVMLWVWVALVPAMAAHLYYFGLGLVFQMCLCIFFAYLFETLGLWLRGQPLKPYLTDLSALVTAMLFALCISPIAPWWIALVGMFFALLVGKHLYGGIGHNLFNPAMLGFAVIIIAFPQAMSFWLAPGQIAVQDLHSGELLRLIFLQQWPAGLAYDAVTEATPLAAIKAGWQQGLTLSEIRDNKVFGDFGGLGWEWIGNWLFIGGLLLLYKRVITWHVPVAVLLTACVFALPFHLYDADHYYSPLQHVFSGGLMLGAFFIATDPTSGASSNRGKLIFGAGVAVFTVLIRNFGSFPDGVAFAVLLMNTAAPLIDRLTVPSPLGGRR